MRDRCTNCTSCEKRGGINGKYQTQDLFFQDVKLLWKKLIFCTATAGSSQALCKCRGLQLKMAGEPESCLPPQHPQRGWSLHHWVSGIILAELCHMPVSLPMGPLRVWCGCSISGLGQAAVVGNTLRCCGHHWQGHAGLIRQFHGSKNLFSPIK